MLTLICGIPNAGKTTYSQKFNNVIHFDDVQKTSVVCEMVAKEDDVCVEGAFLDSRRRRKIAEAYKGKKVCIWLNTPLAECIARENRGRQNGLFRICADGFDPPTYYEGWDEIVIIHDNDPKRVEVITKETIQ